MEAEKFVLLLHLLKISTGLYTKSLSENSMVESSLQDKEDTTMTDNIQTVQLKGSTYT